MLEIAFAIPALGLFACMAIAVFPDELGERIQRIVSRRKHHIAIQIAEDTCSQHGVFCCSECFNMTHTKLA